MKIQKSMNLTDRKKTPLKAIIKGSGFTQRFLARHWNVSESFLSRVIAGKATSDPLNRKIRRLTLLDEGYLREIANDTTR